MADCRRSKKGLLSFFAVPVLLAALVQPASAGPPAPAKPPGSVCSSPGQNGTPTRPFLICTPEDLTLLHARPDAHFELRADLDLAGLAWTPVDSFSGRLDGKGRTIANLTANTGLIRTIEEEGEIRRLKLVNASVYSYYTGGILAGTNRGTVEHVDVSGSIGGRQLLGGLVGYNEGIIRHSRMRGTVTGEAGLGGIAAHNAPTGKIIRSRADVTPDAAYYAGGIAGTNDGVIAHARAHGAIYGNVPAIARVGGIVGDNRGSVIRSRSFNDLHYHSAYPDTVGLVYGDNSGTVIGSRGHGRLIETR